MSVRRAFLFGISDYTAVTGHELPAAVEDTKALYGALSAVGYDVAEPLQGRITGRHLEDELFRAIRTEGADTVLLFYSGHGLHLDGCDYLLPSDAKPPRGVSDPLEAKYFKKSLVELDFADAIASASASTLIFVIDACRDSMAEAFAGPQTTKSVSNGWGQAAIAAVQGKRIATLLACHPGQFARTNRTGEYSLFSRSLAEVIARENRPTSLEELAHQVDQRLSEHFQKEWQEAHQARVRIRSEVSAAEPHSQWRLFDAVQARPVPPNAFRKALDESQLWRQLGKLGEANERQVALRAIADAAWVEFSAARDAVPQDPWADEQYATRVLEQAFRWCSQCELIGSAKGCLSADELALIAAAPFVHELMLAGAKRSLAPNNPCTFQDPSNASFDKLQGYYLSHPQLVRQASRAVERNDPETSEAIAAWLMHAYVRRHPELFWVAESAASRAWASAIQDTEPGRLFDLQRLLELARCVRGEPERIARTDRSSALQLAAEVGAGVIREQLLGFMLCLAGWTALDPRLMPAVGIEHLAISDPLAPDQILTGVKSATWTNFGSVRSLRASCRHPALDAALRAYVEWADSALRAALGLGKVALSEVSKNLPSRLTSDEVLPERRDGIPVYDPNPLRFELAQDEIRELLMGQELYGDPMLAVRELYQNALDACRYRDMRTRYLIQKGEKLEPFAGRIQFRQATKVSRPYIECQDNGIGMSRVELRGCFARAGHRFHDQPEFIEEQADWLALDAGLRLYPNSQFGIGVLSYFMLADEIEVESCRLDRRGKPGERLLFRIPGSGSLFRVESLGPGDAAGTRVRLYIDGARSKPPAGKKVLRRRSSNANSGCAELLRSMLWLAEYETSVVDEDGKTDWPAGVLPEWHELGTGALGATHDPRLWWSESGILLADGIIVGRSAGSRNRVAARAQAQGAPSGILVNLSGAHKPQLTVNRNSIVHYDHAWVEELVVKNCETALSWKGLSLNWLFDVQMPLQQKDSLARELARLGREVKLDTGRDPVMVPVNTYGAFPPDKALLEAEPDQVHEVIGFPPAMVKSRLRHWSAIGAAPATVDEGDTTPDVALEPLWPSDAQLLSSGFDGQSPWLESTAPAEAVYTRAAALRWAPRNVIARLLQLGIVARDGAIWDRPIEQLDIIFASHYVGDRFLLASLLAKAGQLGESPQKLVAELQQVGLVCPDMADAPLVSQLDLRLLSTDASSAEPWIGEVVGLGHVRFLSAKMGRRPAEIAARLQELGIRVQGSAEALPVVSQDDLLILSEGVGGRGPWLDEWAFRPHLLVSAYRSKKSVREVAERLRALGIEPDYAPGELEPMLASDEEVRWLSAALDGAPPWIDETLSVGHVFHVASSFRREPSAVLKRFCELGFGPPPFFEAAGRPTRQDLMLASEELNGEPPWRDLPAWKGHVLATAGLLRLPVEKVAEAWEALGIGCEQLPRKTAPSKEDLRLLSRDRDGLAPWVTAPPTLGAVLDIAWALTLRPTDVATRYRSLGIDCPEISEELDAAFHTTRGLLADDVGTQWLGSEISVGDVVRVASLKNVAPADLATAWLELGLVVCGRYTTGQAAAPSDLALLSKHLNANAPWLSGPVSVTHLLAAWAKLGVEPAQAAARLGEYGFSGPPAVPSIKPSKADLILLSEHGEGGPPWGSDQVRWSRVLGLSAGTQRPPEEICSRLSELGLQVPAIPAYRARPTREDLRILTPMGWPWVDSDVTIGWVRVVATYARLSQWELVEKYERLGIRATASAHAVPLRREDFAQSDLLLLSENLDGQPPWLDDEVPPGFLERAEQRFGFAREKLVHRLKQLGVNA
jgi:hypothetical protein